MVVQQVKQLSQLLREEVIDTFCSDHYLKGCSFPDIKSWTVEVSIRLFKQHYCLSDIPAVNGESCDAGLEPSSATTGDVLPPGDDHEDCSQDAALPDSDTAPNRTSQPVPPSTQAPVSSSAAKPNDCAAASSTFTSLTQGATTITTTSSSSSSSPALGEPNASGAGGGSTSSSATVTTDGAKPRQQVPSAGSSDPLPPG